MESMLATKRLLGAGGWGPARMAVTELEVDSSSTHVESCFQWLQVTLPPTHTPH